MYFKKHFKEYLLFNRFNMQSKLEMMSVEAGARYNFLFFFELQLQNRNMYNFRR